MSIFLNNDQLSTKSGDSFNAYFLSLCFYSYFLFFPFSVCNMWNFSSISIEMNYFRCHILINQSFLGEGPLPLGGYPKFKKIGSRRDLKLQCMSINWASEFSDVGANSAWIVFKTKLEKSMDDCIPTKIRRSDDKPLWMNKNIMRQIRKKRRLWKWYKTTRDFADH